MMIFIKGNVPSLNSLTFSKDLQKYIKDYSYQYYSLKNVKEVRRMLKDKNKPYKIEIYFIRVKKKKFDIKSSIKIVQDLMIKAGWIDEENIIIFKGYNVDKNAGVQINILS